MILLYTILHGLQVNNTWVQIWQTRKPQSHAYYFVTKKKSLTNALSY